MENTLGYETGFGKFDNHATTLTQPATPIELNKEVIDDAFVDLNKEAAEIAIEAEIPPKADRRKGERKVQNADGTVSYGLKADGTPRKKPGRKAKVQ